MFPNNNVSTEIRNKFQCCECFFVCVFKLKEILDIISSFKNIKSIFRNCVILFLNFCLVGEES